MLNQLVTVTLRILFFRAGPQDLPFDPSLSRWLVPLAILVFYVLAMTIMPQGFAAISAIAAVAGLSTVMRLLLKLRSLDNRYVQTYQALLAAGSVIALAMIAPTSQLAPTIMKFYTQDPGTLDQAAIAAQMPAGATLIFDLLSVWCLAVTANILRQATNLPVIAGLLMAMAVTIVLLMFVGFAASVFGALFGLSLPQAPAPPGS